MGNIHDAVNFALAQQGKPYHAYGARFGPNYYDCSGLMNASLNNTGTWCGATNTVGFYKWGRETGMLISVDQAVHTYGAMLIKGKNYGYGPFGHIGFSLGDGRVMAARGSRAGIGISNAYGGTVYQDGLIVPGAYYGPTEAEKIMAAIAAAVKAFELIPMHKGDKRADLVKFAKALLNKKRPQAHLDATDPNFADKMEKVVKAFQKAVGLKVDGVIGPKTIALLVK